MIEAWIFPKMICKWFSATQRQSSPSCKKKSLNCLKKRIPAPTLVRLFANNPQSLTKRLLRDPVCTSVIEIANGEVIAAFAAVAHAAGAIIPLVWRDYGVRGLDVDDDQSASLYTATVFVPVSMPVLLIDTVASPCEITVMVSVQFAPDPLNAPLDAAPPTVIASSSRPRP